MLNPAGQPAIGGYFGLERHVVPCDAARSADFEDPPLLMSGRACIRALVNEFRPAQIWLPFYSCDSLGQPFVDAEIPIRYYPINERFEPLLPEDISAENDVVVAVNFFGLGNQVAHLVAEQSAVRCWLDLTQACYWRTDNWVNLWGFNSFRKFVGVPDGAMIFGQLSQTPQLRLLPANRNYRTEHLILRELGYFADGRNYHSENERRCGQGLLRASDLSKTIIESLNHQQITTIRRENFRQLHSELGALNTLDSEMLTLAPETVPFCYPFLPGSGVNHTWLWERRIFAPVLWDECTSRSGDFTWERTLARRLLPLPIDQRYGPSHMSRIVDVIKQYGS